MSEKLCVFCDHFGWNDIDISCGSTQTGPWISGGGMTCNKRQFKPLLKLASYMDESVRPYDTDDFRKTIQCAERCKHYSPPAQVNDK